MKKVFLTKNRYAQIEYEYGDEKYSSVSANGSGLKEEAPEKVSFVAFKQHFFTTILSTDKAFEKSKLESTNLVTNEDIDTVYTKQFKATVPLAFTNGEVDYKMSLYLGPADYKTLKAYDKNFEKIIPLGWGIFGWINKWIFIPLFGFLSSTIGLSLGIAIIIFTILIKLAMSPITYKSFLSQAKMKVFTSRNYRVGRKIQKRPNEETTGNNEALQQSRSKPNGRMYSGIDPASVYVCIISVLPISF
jgi:YidC/Oxa1 family membrane protein insertase